METVRDFIFLGSKITADGACTRCQVPHGGIRGDPFSADPHLWGPGGEWLSCAELRPGPDTPSRGRLQVRAWHQRWHERAGHRHLLCHHGYVLPTTPGSPGAWPSLRLPLPASMHGGGSAPSCCAFTHRVAFDEGSGPRVLLKSGPMGSIPGSGRSPGGWHWQPTPVFLPGASHGQKSLMC